MMRCRRGPLVGGYAVPTEKEPIMKIIHVLIASGLLAVAGVQAQAPAATDHGQHHPASAAPRSDGEVRKIDREQGKVTLRHGPLQNLDMPAMSMVFRVADPKMLDPIKEGDKVRFTAERVEGNITLTTVELVK
jgi:Cu(I)/Ag(I) efflux system protein CusF